MIQNMHPLGVHSHLFRGTPAAVAAAVRQHGLDCVQLTPSFPGLSFHDPGQITPERCRRAPAKTPPAPPRRAAPPSPGAGIGAASLPAATTFLDPDVDRRHRGLMRLHALLRHCRDFGTPFAVTETGSLNPLSPWMPYPP